MYEVPFGEDGGSGDLDKMRLALLKQNKPAPTPPTSAQIPGYGKPVPPAQTPPDPLAAAAGNFTELATKFNPLMMMKSMQESVRTLNPAIPVAGAWADVAQNVQTAGAEAMYDILGNRKGIEKMQQNYVPVTTGRFYQEPTTPLGKEFETDVMKAMDASKMPAVWPLAMNQPIRPPITPNDVRVIGAEATRVGRQVKNIPTDFYNAQSGLQKLDPITGQPTYGAKLQGVADSVGDIMAQREMQGLPPIPGLPASMQPMNPKLYAMRPEGSRVTSATLPATAKPDAATYAPAQEIIRNVIDSTTMTPVQALDEIQNNILSKPEAASARRAFESFLKQKANEMYPDAPSEGAALAAYKARFGDREASAAHSLEMYDQFLQTPNGIQYRAELDLPSAEELPAMHEAAANWLNSQFTNYIIEKVGTPNEPAAKLASQGLTFYPPSEVFDSADMSGSKIGAKRTAAGMPAKTPTDEALVAANQQLSNLVQQAGDAATRKREQEAIAKQLGYGAVDPNTGVVPEGMNLGRYEPFAQASRESDKANAAYKKQQKAVDNLRLGVAYENATDKAINAPVAKNLKEEIEYGERQFYPALMQTPDTERAYIANPVQLRNLGFEDLAKSFYNDVMSRKIKLDKVPKMTVEKYIRDTAEGRIAEEKLAQAKEKQFKIDADNQFARSAALYIPNDKVFGNVGALEITNRFIPEEVAKLVSEDALALDVCIGEGGNVRGKPNPWHPGTGNRQYIPIYNIVTGQRDPDATSPRMGFINAVEQGSQMVSFRDMAASYGEPVAIFDLNPSSLDGKYNIHFASGHKNGKIKPEYVEGIKSYLNSRKDSIHDVGTFLYDHTGISDSKRVQNRTLAGMISMPVSQFERYDLSGLPRFVTRADISNYIENLKANEPQAPVPAVLSQRPSESLNAYATGAVSSAIDNVLDSQRRAFDEIGESNNFIQAETFFESMRTRFAQDLDRGLDPIVAVDSLNQRLYDLENEYGNSNLMSRNTIADGMQDLTESLNLMRNYMLERQAAEAAQPRAVAQRDNAPDYLRMTHDAALAADRQWGVQTADEVRAALRFISEGRGEIDGPLDPANDTDAYIRALRQQADAAVNGSAEIVLNELADDMESAYMRDWEPEVAPVNQLREDFDFGESVLAQSNELSQEFGDNVGAHFRDIVVRYANEVNPQTNPIEFANRLRVVEPIGAFGGAISLSLQRLASEVAAAATPAQQAPAQPFDWVGALDSLANEVAQNTNPGIGNRVDTIAHRVAERTNPRLDPAGYAAALRAVDFANEHVAVGPALRQLALAVEAAIVEQPPALRAADLDNQRNDRIFQLENAVNDPELNPEDLRFLANELSNPLNQAANNHWISLAEAERRYYAQALRQRANYIEFNPRDFAQRLINEEHPIEYQSTVYLLNDNMYDHEILRGLPEAERARSAQATAVAMNNLRREQNRPAPAAPAAPEEPMVREAGPDFVDEAELNRIEEYRDAAEDLVNGLDEAYYTETPNARAAIRLIRQHLRALRRNGEMAYEDIFGMATTAYEWSPELLAALEIELENLIERYQGMDDYADGGPVRGYQAGGSVKKPDVPTPWLFSVPTYSDTVAYEMYPGQKGQDDQRDAARHMLAAGTLSRKYGPKTAEFLGKAHEFTTSPLQAVKSMFGGQMPADYGMDTHNNRFGAELGQRAKSQAELEDLVQAEAERASRTQTQGQAFIKKANGGIVQENPTTDQMRYALTMRRK